ncbi:hypothetical protein TBLA_0D02310 [Henningerozyma blattae CBS 6284]|uniref:L-type lectin-like domain-containing protein n=1 Tax=Henningerozyma blattae (strain ATCC 34711 / CBS 6284 / DSM 70876 / NBRC 10599 / NRRL Y-10934 / UCD 77-7) TaxID=1071380 RepID=I2H2Y3_HENB6|nr:hypothetical protein TBLA_0D02310 [Tetrapisispora blattae CBS 6284]CCH60735.1 hypothetical protein TBLA_0D02310 [Tetrapisispora blattae CBS 6284]
MLLTQIAAASLAILHISQGHPDIQHESSEVPLKDFSLDNLLSSSSISSKWKLGQDARYNEGRIVLTPKKNSLGSLWLTEDVPMNKNAFTLEWTFRSVGYSGPTSGGLSFWILDSAAPIDLKDQSLFNGPSKYDGLQLLVDNSSPVGPTLRGSLNDGSETFNKQNIYDKTFASCLIGYQDSSVPSTLRLTYDRNADNLLKLQVDNKVCFQTRKIKLSPSNANLYRFGVSADNSNTAESFEILKMKLYDFVTEDSLIPNVKEMAQPKLLTKIIDKASGKEKIVDKEIYDSENSEITNYELYRKLDKVEGKLLANDISILEKKLSNILEAQQEMRKYVEHLEKALNVLTTNTINNNGNDNKDGEAKIVNDNSNYEDFLAMNTKLEQMLNEQQKIRETTSKQNHMPPGPQVEDVLNKLALWLSPLVIIILVMAYYTFKIRQEIVKTKLL